MTTFLENLSSRSLRPFLLDFSFSCKLFSNYYIFNNKSPYIFSILSLSNWTACINSLFILSSKILKLSSTYSSVILLFTISSKSYIFQRVFFSRLPIFSSNEFIYACNLDSNSQSLFSDPLCISSISYDIFSFNFLCFSDTASLSAFLSKF